jgi:high-affinity Fe2+/Pb2+ permease
VAGHAASASIPIATSLTDVLNNIRDWITGILAAIATAFLTWGGLKYLVSAGDPGEVEKAKNALKNAGYGFALAALAPLVVAALQGIVA